ncbi:MAG: hypothetical protein C4K58_03645 [Flavobacteriaceae bacterium]|nr:MAG: hypothetical protein C4K58_03645 [Flavobacteriaceae bacterium]
MVISSCILIFFGDKICNSKNKTTGTNKTSKNLRFVFIFNHWVETITDYFLYIRSTKIQLSMDLSNLLQGVIGQQLISGLASKLGIENNKTAAVLTMAVPLILSALNKNSNTPEGAAGIENALNKHNGDLLSNLSGFISGGDFSDGSKMLGHILGGNQGGIIDSISKSTGVDSNGIGSILSAAAPILMNSLGQQKQQQGLDASGISDLLTNVVGGMSQKAGASEMGMFEKMLDQNGDGNTSDELLNIGGKLLGGLFK